MTSSASQQTKHLEALVTSDYNSKNQLFILLGWSGGLVWQLYTMRVAHFENSSLNVGGHLGQIFRNWPKTLST